MMRGSLPRAHDGCRCACHRRAGVRHCVPCCGPGSPRKASTYRDRDGTATAAANEDLPVPKDCQARPEGIAQ